MARREAEVMSLEWHLEQDSHLTHHTTDSERIDGVNENIWLNPQREEEEEERRTGQTLHWGGGGEANTLANLALINY